MKSRDKSTFPVSGWHVIGLIIQVLAMLVSRCTTLAEWPVSANHSYRSTFSLRENRTEDEKPG